VEEAERKARVEGGAGWGGRLGWKKEEDWRKGSVKGEVGWEKELGRRKTGCEEG